MGDGDDYFIIVDLIIFPIPSDIQIA